MSNKTYYKRKTLGLCPICGKENDREDRISCSACREKQSACQAEYLSRMTDEEKDARRRYMREHAKKRRDALRAQGRCAECGMPCPETYTCKACRQRANEQRLRRKQEKGARP